LLKPDTPHESPESPAPHIVVLGKFVPMDTNEQWQFSVGFFENENESGSIEITASRKSEGLKQVFEISSKTPSAELDFH